MFDTFFHVNLTDYISYDSAFQVEYFEDVSLYHLLDPQLQNKSMTQLIKSNAYVKISVSTALGGNTN